METDKNYIPPKFDNKLYEAKGKRITIFKIIALFFLISSLITLMIWSYLYEKDLFEIVIISLLIIIFSRIDLAYKIKRDQYWYTKRSARQNFLYVKNLFENETKEK